MFSQLALYVPATLTVIVLVVAPVLHFRLPTQPVAVKVDVSLGHKLGLVALTVGATGAVPVLMIIAFELPLVPQVLLHVAV